MGRIFGAKIYISLIDIPPLKEKSTRPSSQPFSISFPKWRKRDIRPKNYIENIQKGTPDHLNVQQLVLVFLYIRTPQSVLFPIFDLISTISLAFNLVKFRLTIIRALSFLNKMPNQ